MHIHPAIVETLVHYLLVSIHPTPTALSLLMLQWWDNNQHAILIHFFPFPSPIRPMQSTFSIFWLRHRNEEIPWNDFHKLHTIWICHCGCGSGFYCMFVLWNEKIALWQINWVFFVNILLFQLWILKRMYMCSTMHLHWWREMHFLPFCFFSFPMYHTTNYSLSDDVIELNYEKPQVLCVLSPSADGNPLPIQLHLRN